MVDYCDEHRQSFDGAGECLACVWRERDQLRAEVERAREYCNKIKNSQSAICQLALNTILDILNDESGE